MGGQFYPNRNVDPKNNLRISNVLSINICNPFSGTERERTKFNFQQKNKTKIKFWKERKIYRD